MDFLYDIKNGSVVIKDGVTAIPDVQFHERKDISSITIPDSVTTIGASAFSRCYNLISVTIPDSVTSIGEYAFLSCSGLTSITIPDSVTSIGDCTFLRCTNLAETIIGNSVTTIEEYAFSNCSNLIAVTLGNGITTIEKHAFNNCHPYLVIHNAPWWFDREHAGLSATAVVNYRRLTIIPRLMTSEKSEFDFRVYSCYRGIISQNLTLFMYLIFNRISRKYELAIQKYQANTEASPLDLKLLLPPIPVETVNLINSFIAFRTLDLEGIQKTHEKLKSLGEISFKP